MLTVPENYATISVSGTENLQPDSDVAKHHDTRLLSACEEWFC